MRIDIDTTASTVSLLGPDEFTSFDAAVPAGATADQVEAALAATGAGTLEASGDLTDAHVHVRTGWLREAAVSAGGGAEWDEGFAGMVAYATSKGWTDADAGTVRAHVVLS